ncbi:hypothetical protein JR316_0008652 [Psilocybe cubensis]|nr:hypothetical protein JR316_0008652 [Psilocybe cubensis]KAH9478199.1 hypothetical protein JR316_0008652 [Psilocybe cubensis]
MRTSNIASEQRGGSSSLPLPMARDPFATPTRGVSPVRGERDRNERRRESKDEYRDREYVRDRRDSRDRREREYVIDKRESRDKDRDGGRDRDWDWERRERRESRDRDRGREERYRSRDREYERERDRAGGAGGRYQIRDRERVRDRERDRYRSPERDRDRDNDERDKAKRREKRDREREREMNYERERERERMLEREAERERERERQQRDRSRDALAQPKPKPQIQQISTQRQIPTHDIHPAASSSHPHALDRERPITPIMSSSSLAGSNLSLTVNYVPTKFSAPPSPSSGSGSRLGSWYGSGAGVYSAGAGSGTPAGGPRKRVPYHYTRASASRMAESSSPSKAADQPRQRHQEPVFGAGIVPKMGGGVDAFRSGEARIGGRGDGDGDEYGDEDEGAEGVNEDDGMLREDTGRRGWFGKSGPGMGTSTGKVVGGEGVKITPRARGPPKKKLRWNRFKWMLFVANFALTTYSFTTLILILLTWFNIFTSADIIRVGNRTELIISTLFSISGILVSLIGWAGILTNNRSFLALYTALLWVVFILVLVPGYMTYKRRTFNLEGKVNKQWSQDLGAEGRVRIQNALRCCGYFSPFVEATVSQTCYARSLLPGCKKDYMDFERRVLKVWYTVAFGAIVPLHLAVMIISLLCANHVTYRFGKGMMPKAYRLSRSSMVAIMNNYVAQLAEQYGEDVAADVLARSKSNLNLQMGLTIPTVPYVDSGNNVSTVANPSSNVNMRQGGGGNGGVGAARVGGGGRI